MFYMCLQKSFLSKKNITAMLKLLKSGQYIYSSFKKLLSVYITFSGNFGKMDPWIHFDVVQNRPNVKGG